MANLFVTEVAEVARRRFITMDVPCRCSTGELGEFRIRAPAFPRVMTIAFRLVTLRGQISALYHALSPPRYRPSTILVGFLIVKISMRFQKVPLHSLNLIISRHREQLVRLELPAQPHSTGLQV